MSTGKKILFVDDDRDFLRSQSILFSSRGYQVLTAESGEEALKLLQNEVPDMIFLDLMMEHYDTGFTLSFQIRKDDRFKDVPLVMLSGVASQTGRRFDKQTDELKKWSKLDAFMDKPVTGKQLLKVVEEKLGLAARDGH
ncbi:MAG TPA: response regulator [Candidatus Acidoferrum sp.]|nr:response regulator [Candidatus Acidoferrum sp.]